MRTTPEKEKYDFTQKSREIKKSNTKMKGESDCFHCGDPNNSPYDCTQISDKERYEISATKEKGRGVYTQVIEVVQDNNN